MASVGSLSRNIICEWLPWAAYPGILSHLVPCLLIIIKEEEE